MKTAMQELKNHIDIDVTLKMCTKEYANRIKWYIDEYFIEKEKQQIIEAATHGANFDKSPYSSAHEYYEKTFEQ